MVNDAKGTGEDGGRQAPRADPQLCLLQAGSPNSHGFLSNLATRKSWQKRNPVIQKNDCPARRWVVLSSQRKLFLRRQRAMINITTTNNNDNSMEVCCRLTPSAWEAYRVPLPSSSDRYWPNPMPGLFGSILKHSSALRAVIFSSCWGGSRNFIFCWMLNMSPEVYHKQHEGIKLHVAGIR